MKINLKTKTSKLLRLFILALFLVCLLFPINRAPITASAQVGYNDLIHIQKYEVDMTVEKDRTVRVKERITVKFLKNNLTTFYRSLPKESARYYDISASCNDGKEFSYTVKNNPDNDDFIDINCIGGAEKGNIRTYDIAFSMQNGINAGTKRNGMIIDVIPFGFTVDLHEVSATVRFPYPVAEDTCALYTGYGAEEEDATLNKHLSEDKKTLTFSTSLLPRAYNETFDEYVAKGVTVDFTFTDGKFEGYTSVRLFTDGLWVILLLGALGVGLAILLLTFTRTKRELITTVNLTAPDNMDPMKMGKLLDGTVDSEDVTSMLYYFAHKGYLTIDLTNESNPVFHKKTDLPPNASLHEKTLFNGLFKEGDSVSANDLQYKFFDSVERAKLQLPAPKMYDKKSVFGYLAGGVLAELVSVCSAQVLAFSRLGKHYISLVWVAFIFPVAGMLFIRYIQENYRYKWKRKTQKALNTLKTVIGVIFVFIFSFFLANHILTEFEKLLICAFSFAGVIIIERVLSRTEGYLQTLGQILGFKDFIVYTEEDKIKVMLEENPELYYKVLPYAQVLGVTDEWENKFSAILLSPPTWCTCADISAFDIWFLNRCMRNACTVALAKPLPQGGGFVGKSGGGGRFGGFGGGGFGGGGGGAR